MKPWFVCALLFTEKGEIFLDGIHLIKVDENIAYTFQTLRDTIKALAERDMGIEVRNVIITAMAKLE
jgi:hypothetical protein